MLLLLFLIVSTLAWIPATTTCIVQNDNELPCSTCVVCAFTKDIRRYWSVHEGTNTTCRPYSSNSGNKSLTVKCAFTIYSKISNNSCLYRTGGNDRVVTRFAVFAVRLEWFLKINGHIRFDVKTKYLPKAQVRTVLLKSKRIYTCVFYPHRWFYQGSFVNMLHHVRLKRYLINRVRVLMGEIRTRGRSSVLGCKKCCTSSGSASREKRESKGRQFGASERRLFKRSLRERRNVLKNTSTSTTYSTYLPFTGDSSRLPVTTTHTGQSRSVLCPQTAVIDSSTIFLTHSAFGDEFKGTLVPTNVLTPLPEAIATIQVAQDTPANGSNQTNGARANVTAPLTSISQARTSKQTVTFIYDSRLVSIVSSTSVSNSSYAFITTWNCASVTRATHSPLFEPSRPTSSSARVNSTSITPSKGNHDDKMKWVVGVIVGGGTSFAFVLIILLAILIRRYRRRRSHRRKAKQISYFNRYDRSSAWEEPFGGSKLSVFTLKNSKFDIDNDWETSNEPRRGTTRSDDFEGK